MDLDQLTRGIVMSNTNYEVDFKLLGIDVHEIFHIRQCTTHDNLLSIKIKALNKVLHTVTIQDFVLDKGHISVTTEGTYNDTKH